MGGSAKFNTKWRDWGCPLVGLLVLINIHSFNIGDCLVILSYFLTFLLMWGAMSTYWDFIPFNKGEDNFFMHGVGIGLSTLPLMLVGIHLYSIMIYAVVLAVSMGIWSKYIKKDVIEEFGRGALIVALLPLLVI
jgi:hypothetical protein